MLFKQGSLDEIQCVYLLFVKAALPIGCLFLPLSAFAATEADTATSGNEDKIVVSAKSSLPPLGSYENTGTKSDLTAQDTPQTINTVEGQELDERGISSLNEALRYVSGVTTENRGGAITRFDEFTIRGFKTAKTTSMAYNCLITNGTFRAR